MARSIKEITDLQLNYLYISVVTIHIAVRNTETFKVCVKGSMENFILLAIAIW